MLSSECSVLNSRRSSILLRLDAWFETMRGPRGYTGPVAHWWQNCLHFTGAALDWRYEGIIQGYLHLYKGSGDATWLARARRAGDDLLQGQLSSANYRHSSFELNPYAGGTPHEAACDLALLSLADVLRQEGDPDWPTYRAAAERNLRGYYIAVLWDEEAQGFRDHPRIPSFVPNKSATLVEALLQWAALTGDGSWVEVYARPTLQAILAHQVRGGVLDGAIHQYSVRGRFAAKFFPYYTARCVSGLVAGYEALGDERLLDAARRAMAFVLRWRYDDGSFPQVVYPPVRGLCPRGANGSARINRYPQWVAAVGDILRAMARLRPYGLDADPRPTEEWLLRGQGPTGAFRTAHGFAAQISQRHPGPLPEFRDLLPACGWNDKALRYLAESRQQKADSGLRCVDYSLLTTAYETQCTWRGSRCLYREDGESIELRRGAELLYRWQKGAPWAEVCVPEMWWK